VVFVRAQIIQQVQDPFDLFPAQERSISTGSGFLIDTAGDILTNFHVIEGANRSNGVTVQFEDNVTRTAAVVAQDPDKDLALLKADIAGVPAVHPLVMGDSTTVQVGDPTLAIGNPFGLDRTLTSGIVSALQRQIQGPSGFSIDNVIQTDAPINPGNSGGPLLDAGGRVIGISSQIATAGGNSEGNVGIGFAIPINTAKEFIPRLKHDGKVQIADIGVNGVAVAHPEPGIVAVAGSRVSSMGDLLQIVQAHLPGQSVTVRARQRGHIRTFKVKLGSRSISAPQ
jgi:putative serine protease PepD